MSDIAPLKNKINPILKRHGIQKAGLFGSAVHGEEHPEDIDLLVKIDKKISLLDFIGIKQELEDELGMKVDLVEYDAIKPELRDEILSGEVPIL